VALLARLLAVASALAIAGCYQPSLRDCTVTCHAAGECASGQVCGADGYCAAPAIAGTCKVDARAAIDAPQVADAPIDAPPPIDGPPDATAAQLHITVSGKGTVSDSSGTRTCTTDCLFNVADGDLITLTAVGMGAAHPFQDWATANCMGMGPTCTVTIVPPVTAVTATFK
jgi:hypothetical protein